MFKTTIGHLAHATGYFVRGEQGQPVEAPFARPAGLKLPAHLTFRIAKLAQAVESVIQDFQKTHQGLLEKYGTKNEQGFSVPGDKLEAFNTELNEVLAVEIELPGDKLTSEQIAFASISVQDILALQWMFSDFDKEEVPDAEPKQKKKLAAVK